MEFHAGLLPHRNFWNMFHKGKRLSGISVLAFDIKDLDTR
jgi:hypothetical protein